MQFRTMHRGNAVKHTSVISHFIQVYCIRVFSLDWKAFLCDIVKCFFTFLHAIVCMHKHFPW